MVSPGHNELTHWNLFKNYRISVIFVPKSQSTKSSIISDLAPIRRQAITWNSYGLIIDIYIYTRHADSYVTTLRRWTLAMTEINLLLTSPPLSNLVFFYVCQLWRDMEVVQIGANFSKLVQQIGAKLCSGNFRGQVHDVLIWNHLSSLCAR